MTSEAATSSPRSTSERRLLALLFLAYLLNFLDRQILEILKIPIKAELGLTDTQLGLMGGIAFAALYSTLAIPLARLADRRGRVKVIAGSVAVWSAATAVCGAATGFASLFVARMVRSLALALPLYMLAYCAAQAWLGPVFGAVQRMVAPDIRASASAWLLLLVNLVGIGVGTFIFGFARDRLSLTYGPDALRFALLGGLAFYLVASGLMLAAAIRIGRDSNAA